MQIRVQYRKHLGIVIEQVGLNRKLHGMYVAWMDYVTARDAQPYFDCVLDAKRAINRLRNLEGCMQYDARRVQEMKRLADGK